MKKFYTLTFLLMTIFVASTATGQEFFEDRDAWLAALTGTVIEDDFGRFGEPIEDALITDLGDPIDLAFGQLSTTDPDNGVFFVNDIEGAPFFPNFNFFGIGTGFIFTDYVITPDTETNGELEGFCLCTANDSTISNEPAMPLVIELFNGTDLVSTLMVPPTLNVDVEVNYCWINDTGSTITSFTVGFGGQFGGICDIDLAFCPVVDDSCRGQIQSLIADLESLLPTGSNSDDYFIQEALVDLNAIDDDALFDGDLLNEYGLYFFFRAKFGVFFLQHVYDSDVSAQIDAFNAIVQCVTQAAIDEAIIRGGDQDFIDFAIELEDFAQYLEDGGYFLDAILFRKFAWAYAFSA